jgi:hypothetical protein
MTNEEGCGKGSGLSTSNSNEGRRNREPVSRVVARFAANHPQKSLRQPSGLCAHIVVHYSHYDVLCHQPGAHP